MKQTSPTRHADKPRGNEPTVESDVGEFNVGLRVRALREARGLSIRALAGQAGISVNTLSLIENSRSSPTVSTLQGLAAALEVPMTAFFEAGSSRTSIVHVKGGTQRKVPFANGSVEDLGAGFVASSLQSFIVRLRGSSRSVSQPIVHSGYEFVLCLKGRIEYQIEQGRYNLEPGDSLLFESHLPHRWRNMQPQPSEFLVVLCRPDSMDNPGEHHFRP